MNLDKSRKRIDQINLEFFKLYKERKELVSKIISEKTLNGANSWSAQREWYMFKSLPLDQLSLKELFLISYMIELQATSLSDYPAWSEGAHLEEKIESISARLNPVLLFLKNKAEYCSLKIHSDIKKEIEELDE